MEQKTYRLGLYEKAMPSDLGWEEKLNSAADSGFDYVEISIDESEEKLKRLYLTDAEIGSFVKAMQNTGVRINSMCLSGHRKYPLGSHDPKIREKSLELMERALNFASLTGIRLIQLAGYDVYYEEHDPDTEGYFYEGLGKAVELAQQAGVILGFETMETEFMDTVSKAMFAVTAVNSPYLGIYPDIGNLNNAAIKYGHDIAEDLRTGVGHIFAAHLKETEPGKYRNMTFGTGVTPYVKCISELWKQRVRLYTGEFWYQGSSDWREDLKSASCFLRTQIEVVQNG